MSVTINIASEEPSYTFKNSVLILVLQKVEKHQYCSQCKRTLKNHVWQPRLGNMKVEIN